jgi:hypothetical protein
MHFGHPDISYIAFPLIMLTLGSVSIFIFISLLYKTRSENDRT